MTDEAQARRNPFLDIEQEILVIAERPLSVAGLAHMLGTDTSKVEER